MMEHIVEMESIYPHSKKKGKKEKKKKIKKFSRLK